MALASNQPNYRELVEFLVTPFLDKPEALRFDCESYADQSKLWIRLAFDQSDKGRVFGKGGRTIQAIRRVVDIAGQLADQKVHLEVYGMNREESRPSGPNRRGGPRRSGSRRPRS